MICPNCSAENPAGNRFCGDCGTPLASACPNCGASNPPGNRFCGDCGTALNAAGATAGSPSRLSGGRSVGAAPVDVAPVAERRHVTVLFADLVGFTPFAEERDAEEVRETLNRYFELASEVIGRYGGTIEKFIGDAVMAVWGAPVAHEDDPERAVRAGLDLVDSVRSLGPGIQARAGVLTGEAAVTIGATNQGMVAGDLVNTAARLQSLAPPGTVLVGETTQRAAAAAVAFEPAGEQLLKGKAAPVPAWRALRVVAELGGRNRAESLEAPFVGREVELRLLKDLYHATGREKRARLVSVVGPAGIGKSRLAWEFSKYTDGLVEDMWWHHGRSPSYGEGITFWALGEMVRGRCGLGETDDEATTRAKVAATVGQHVQSEAERQWIGSALLALLGVETGNVGPEQLFAAWRSFFEHIAASATVVMVFEDIQWADAGLLDFIDSLLEWSRNNPIYVITLARPDLLERRPEWGAGKRNFSSIYLEPLPEDAMRELLAGLVPGLPEAAVRAIVGRADGVPLYAVETVRMLLADGRLTAQPDGTYEPAGDLSSIAVPESLNALIAARLDGLDAADRALLQESAVLGQSFTLASLAAVSGTEETTLQPRLKALVRRELLSLEGDVGSPERGQYAFVQALIREVAYNTVAKRERKNRHLAAARYFESLGTDELAGALAGQYLAAYRNSPDGEEADAVAGQARIALTAAAERAVALGSNEQALAFFEEAMSVTTDPTETAELLELAGQTASRAGHHDRADRLLRDAVERRHNLDDRPATVRATTALGWALLNAVRTPDALRVLEPAAAEFRDLAADPATIGLGAQLSRAYFLGGEMRRAIEVAEPVLEAAEHADLAAIVADLLVTKGTALCGLGRVTEGLAVLEAGRHLAEARNFGGTLFRANVNRSEIEASRDPRAALEVARTWLPLAKRLGIREMATLGNGAESAIRTGDWAWALDRLEEAITDDLETSDRAFLVPIQIAIEATMGKPPGGGLEEFEQEIDRLGLSADPSLRANVDLAIAFTAFADGRLADARDAWRKSGAFLVTNQPRVLLPAARAALWLRDIAGAQEDLADLDAGGVHGPAIEASRVTIRAGLAALAGHAAEALVLYRDALAAWRDLGLAWDEALTGMDMAILLDPADPEVAAAADTAREILVRLEAAPLIKKLDEALTTRPNEPATAPVEAEGVAT